jgi:hypothetical protein
MRKTSTVIDHSLVVAALSAGGLALALASSSGCGGAPAATQAPAAPKPEAMVASPPPPPDLSPVPDPQTLVVSGRAARVGASLAVVHAWSKLPMPQSEQVTELVTSEAIGPLVDLDQPIDFAVAVGGSGPKMRELTAISAAVKDPDRVKAALSERYKLVPGDNGALLIQGLGKRAAKDDDDDDGTPDAVGDAERTCELAPAYGAVPVRMVCAFSPNALTELGPWLTRTATRAATTADLHVDVRMAPLKATLSGQKRFLGILAGGLLGGRSGMGGLRDLVSGVAGDVADFALDLDTATLDLTLSDPGANATLTMKLGGRTSELGRLATAHPERSGPAPAAFWQLPGDADLAFFDRGVDDAALAKGRELVVKLAGDELTDIGVKDADRKAIVDALGKLASPAPLVYASGLDAAQVKKAAAAEKGLGTQADAAERGEARRAMAQALLGWRIAELDEPSAKFTAALKELAAAWSKPAVVAAYRAKSKDEPAPSLHVAPLPKGVALAAGTQHYLLEVGPFEHEGMRLPPAPPDKAKAEKKPAGARKPVAFHVFVVPDGQRTWIAMGGDEALVAAKVAGAMGSAGDKLSARPELESFKNTSLGAGGFVTARGLPEIAQQLPALFGMSSSVATEGIDEAASMPHQGVVPIPFTVTAQQGSSPAPVVATLQVPRAAIDDVVAAILRHGGF